MTTPLPSPLLQVAVIVAGTIVATLGCGSRPPVRSQPAATAGTVGTRATLDPKKILFTLSAQDQVRQCLRSSPEAHGTVTLRWNVTQSGDVTHMKASTTLPDASVAECLAEEIGKLNFGRVEHPSDARWTFVRHLDGLMLTAERDAMERKSHKKKRKARGAGRDARPKGYDDGVAVVAGSDGWLDPAVVEQRAHASLQLYAHCFREAFARDRELSGLVKLRLRIDGDGTVGSVRDAGSDLPDAEAVSCVGEGFYAMRFPRPEGGPVEVTYPVLFNIDDD